MDNTPYALVAVCLESKLGFRGNTAAVLQLTQQPDESYIKHLAADFNQPATTYLWPEKDGSFGVRWFAPDGEIGLCGHGTLAALDFLAAQYPNQDGFTLKYKEGVLKGKVFPDQYCEVEMAGIPVIEEQAVPEILPKALGMKVLSYYKTNNKDIVLVENETALREMKPDFALLRERDTFGYSVTAPGDTVDFVSRTLVPHVQQLEDHATGSSHAALTPFWSDRLQKETMKAYQLSPRGGAFECRLSGDMVTLKVHYQSIASGEVQGPV